MSGGSRWALRFGFARPPPPASGRKSWGRHNATAEGERLASSWPATGPAVVWQRPVGHGYSGLAVAGGRAVLFHRLGNEAVAEAIDARSGKTLWKQSFPTNYQTSIAPDDGPRCVPLLHEERVYLFGADGDLHCLRLDSGAVVWSRDADRQYKAPLGYFGAGSTPIVEGGKLLVNIGGPAAGIVAFSLADGKTVWTATDESGQLLLSDRRHDRRPAARDFHHAIERGVRRSG